MTSRFNALIKELLKEYDRTVYKHKNYTDTYEMKHLDTFLMVVRTVTINNHAKKVTLEELDEQIDKMAKDVEEYRIHQQPWRWSKKRDRL